MRSGVIGFLAGVAVMVAAFLAMQQVVIRSTVDDIPFDFSTYVFSGPQFPRTYYGNGGQVFTHFLFPIRSEVRYYDSQYNEVTSAEKPGRYGAVVRLGLNGGAVSRRYITLYRTPEKIYWGDGTGSVTGVELPPGTGIDPQVARNQQAAIGQAVLYAFFDQAPECAVILAGLSEASPQDPPSPVRNSLAIRDQVWWFGLRKKLGLEPHYPCITDLPEGYDADPAKKWPLILYLHSNARAGSDLRALRENELPGDNLHGLHLPAIVVAPQCPLNENWMMPAIFDLLDSVSAKYRVDLDHVYLIGSSSGADSVVGMATQQPERFAAIATVAGENDFSNPQQLKKLPYWSFEGGSDEVMNPANPANLVAAIRQAGSTQVHFTLYPGLGHGCWDKAFNDPVLWRWLFAQKRGQPEVVTEGVPSS